MIRFGVKQRAQKINSDVLGLLIVYLEPHRTDKLLKEWIQNFKSNTQLARWW